MKELSPLRQSIHIPVMPEEVISYLDIQPDGIYVDGTCGLGGHSKFILSNLSSDGFLISIDLDQSAIEICKENLNAQNSKLHIEKNSYSNLPIILDHLGIKKVDGILLDLGLSSMQLDSIDRGFSFSKDSYLDMRFDQSSSTSAADLINNSTESELADIIYHFGEERRSRSIAKKLIESIPISSVQDLVNAVKRVTPPHRRNRTMAREFQGFRNAVN